jgi:hypothetical protein
MEWKGHIARLGETKDVHTEFLVGEPVRRRALRRLGTERSIILKWIVGKWNGVLEWLHLAQNRDPLKLFVNRKNFRFRRMLKIYFVAEELLAPQGLSAMKSIN